MFGCFIKISFTNAIIASRIYLNMIREPGYKQKRIDRNKRDVRQMLFYTGLFTLLVVALSLKRCLGPAFKHGTYYPPQKEKSDLSFNWNTANRFYTAHAKCRMDCRHIDDKKVSEILRIGTINYDKSELNEPDCQKKFAIDGYTSGQHVRVVASPCGNQLTIITCIDLDHKWPCACGEDY